MNYLLPQRPLRLELAWLALALAAALVLAPGCATRSSKPAADSESSAVTADYSQDAVRARIESHAHYTAAILHEQNDEPELAANEMYQAALADPGNETLVLEAVGRLLRLRGPEGARDKSNAAREKALEVLKKSANRPDASGLLYSRLGLVLSIMGKRDQAIDANRKAIQKSPDLLSGYQYLAQLYLQHNETDEGIKVLDEAAKRSKVDALFLIELGETYTIFARGGKLDVVRAKALEVFKRAAELKPTNPVLLQRLADGFSFLGDVDNAVALYLRLLERMPSLTPLRDKLAELYLRKQDRTNAAAQLRAVIRDSPANPQTHYLLGSILFEDKNPKEAAECFSKTILLSPNFEPAYYDLAAAQINNEQPKEALETLAKAKEKFSENFVSEFYTALAYSGMKDFTNALRHLTSAEVIARATATNRLTHSFYFQLGSAYERNQQYQEAEKYFRKAIELSPDFAEALNYLGYMWAERGQNLEEAHRLIDKAIKLEPKNAAFLDSMAWVLFKLEKPKDALKWILQAVENSKEPDPTLYDHLGDIYSAMHQTEKAREAWSKSLSLEPNPQIEKKMKGATPAP